MASLKERHVDPLLVLRENTGGEAWGASPPGFQVKPRRLCGDLMGELGEQRQWGQEEVPRVGCV